MNARRAATALSLITSLALLGACTQMASRSAAPPAQLAPSAATPARRTWRRTSTRLRAWPRRSARQQSELAAALAAARQSPTAANRLRYALALGAAGHKDSNPVEAKRLLANLLAEPNDLGTHELELANAFLREFDARVALYAELARQREESEQKLKANDNGALKRADTLAAENARLKKQLVEANRKLEAVAEMERSLQEQTQDQAPETAPDVPPPRP